MLLLELVTHCFFSTHHRLTGKCRAYSWKICEAVFHSDGYHDFIETLLVRLQSAEAQQMRDWAGGYFDPQQCDIRIANAAILRMMYNGWGGK